jgi:glucosamine--fructose-6-phosphate aminotransferase (isomerizing)
LLAVDKYHSLGFRNVIGITCYEDSSLAKIVPTALVARQAHEESIAQTRSFTSMLVASQGLATVLAGKKLSEESLRLPRLGASLLDDHAGLAKMLGEDASLERFFFLGSGPFYGLACEAMLKMKEMSLSYSEAFHFMEFRHGPMSMVDRHSLVVGMLSETGFSHEFAVLGDMRILGARVLALTPHALPRDHADYQCVLPGGLTDLERGPLYLPVLQLLAYYRSLLNGQNPDRPNNLSAVVHLNIES